MSGARDYAEIATRYAREVVDGAVVACRWVRLACARHLRDLERDAAGEWRYTWNPELVLRDGRPYRPVERICRFAELMPHIKGDWAARRARISLEPWQVFLLASVFGWIDRESGERRGWVEVDGERRDWIEVGGARQPLPEGWVGWFYARRRFREADLFVPRKNAKSTLAAIVGLYMLALDEEHGAEVYSGATTEKQAGEVFVPARLMAEQSPEYRGRFGVQTLASVITQPETNSKFERVIGRPGDGASPSCAIVDEYHEHATEDLHDTMRTGMGARRQPLLLVITTAGTDIAAPCYQHQLDLQQILEGVVENDQRFGVIYGIDEKDDPYDEAALRKANPNFGVSIDAEFLLTQQRDAQRDPRKAAIFLTKHCNVWVASSSPWLNLHAWQRAADTTLREEHFRGQPVYRGCDLASTTDIASECKMFLRVIDGRQHIYLFWRHYLPESQIQNPDNKHYQGWKRAGHLIETPGGMIDVNRIEQDILADDDKFRPVEDAFDPWGSAQITANLEAAGHTVVLVPMQVNHLSPAMKWIEGLLADGRLHHNGDPVAQWAVSNVIVREDNNGNIFPRKQTRDRKIDPAIAMILAAARARLAQPVGGTFDDFLAGVVAA